MLKKKYKDIKVTDRAKIAKDRLLNPELEKRDFAEKHWITVYALSKIESLLNFDEDVATTAIVSNILAKDNALIELSTDIKQKWAENLKERKTIQNKDIETLDRIETTAMKRVALVKAEQEAKDKDEAINITITL